MRSVPADNNENMLFQTWVDEWNAQNSEVQVELTLFPTSDYVAGPVLTTAFASGTGPDIFLISPGKFLQYAEGGIAADLTDLFTPEFEEDLQPAALEAITVDGVPYAVPFEQEPVALFYNQDLFDEAELAVPNTWEELLSGVGKRSKSRGLRPSSSSPHRDPIKTSPGIRSFGRRVQTLQLPI